MKLPIPLLLVMLAVAAPARAVDLPTWEAQEGPAWPSFTFTDRNGAAHTLYCNPANCARTGGATVPLFELTEVSRVALTVNNGAVAPGQAQTSTVYRVTYSTKLSHWSLRGGNAVQGTETAALRESPPAAGVRATVRPPTAQLDDAFVARAATPPAGGPRTRPRTPPGPAAGNPDPHYILDFTLFGETGELVDGRAYEEKESDWLTHAQHQAYLQRCPQRQGVAPTDTPDCRAAVTAARQQIAQNMRDSNFYGTHTYRSRYAEIIGRQMRNNRDRDTRATDLLTLLAAVKNMKYGQPPNSQDEVSLNDAEKARLRGAAAGARTANKTGAVLLQEYEAMRGALVTANANDHVGFWQLTNQYRQEVPPAGPAAGPGTTQPGTALTPLTPEELRSLARDQAELDAYNGVMNRQPPASEADRRAAIERARRWLDLHPTGPEFNGLAQGDARRGRICDEYRRFMQSSSGSGAATNAEPGSTRALPQLTEENRAGATNPDGSPRTTSGVMNGDRPAVTVTPGASAPRYTYPAEVVAGCSTTPAGPPRDTSGGVVPVPGGSSGNITGPVGVGQPIAGTAAGGSNEPLTKWNPLLNGAKGALAGAIVGFALGGPLGMAVGALVFGLGAWGLTKIGDA